MFWQHSEKKLLKKPKIYGEFKYLIDEMNSSFFMCVRSLSPLHFLQTQSRHRPQCQTVQAAGIKKR